MVIYIKHTTQRKTLKYIHCVAFADTNKINNTFANANVLSGYDKW